MSLTKELCGNEYTAQLVRELQFCEEEVAKIAESVKRRNEEYADVEESIIKLFGDDADSVDLTDIVDDRRSITTQETQRRRQGFDTVQQQLEISERNEVLMGTALKRITAFIMQYEEKRIIPLNFLRKATSSLQNAVIESENEIIALKNSLSIMNDEGVIRCSADETPKFSSTEERMAPRYVESTRLSVRILKDIATIIVLLKKKQELRLLYRKFLEESHERIKEQLTKQRGVLKDARRAIDTAEKKVHDIHLDHVGLEEVRTQALKELNDLALIRSCGITGNGVDMIHEIKEGKISYPLDLAALRQELEDAKRDLLKAENLANDAIQQKKIQEAALEDSSKSLNEVKEELETIIKEKIDVEKRRNCSESAKEKHLYLVEKQNQEIKELQIEANDLKVSMQLVRTEMEPFFISLTEAKEEVEAIKERIDSFSSRTLMLQEELKTLDNTVESLRVECTIFRKELLEVQHSIHSKQCEESENLRALEYILSLKSDEEQNLESKNIHDRSHVEMLALRRRQLLERARKEHQRVTYEANVFSGSNRDNLGSLKQTQADQLFVLHDASSSKQRTSSVNLANLQISMRSQPVATTSDIAQVNVQGRCLREASTCSITEEHPASTTSRIVVDPPKNSSGINQETHYAVSQPSPSMSYGFSTSQHEDVANLCVNNTMQEKRSGECAPVIVQINHRLHEILSRKY